MKLEGFKVVDLSWFLPGPLLTLAMADHGAEVIKFEPAGEGDPGRHIGPMDGEESVFFRNLNRGKKSAVVNLKDPRDLAAVLAHCDGADVFVESFRPGVADRLGVGYAALAARNPGIVYCSISAFGEQGAYPGRPAHDLALEALAGVLSLTLGDDGRPAVPGIPIADLVSGLQGLSGVLMALLRRAKTGKGDRIDISMHDALLAACANVIGPALLEDRQPEVKLERTTGGAAFYRIYETADGRQLVLAGQEAKFIRTLLEHLGRPDLIAACLDGPGAHQRPVIDFLAATFATRTLAAWTEELAGLDVCFGPVNTLPEALADPNALQRQMVLTDETGRRHLGSPIRFRDEPARPVLQAPRLGEHTNQIVRRDPTVR
ncbi:MAG: CoA transferase [Rhizobiales bacterium]|nr:CoA transferase [Hyphomicrobiales bacterium]